MFYCIIILCACNLLLFVCLVTRYRTFTVLGVNLLPYKLQEVLLLYMYGCAHNIKYCMYGVYRIYISVTKAFTVVPCLLVILILLYFRRKQYSFLVLIKCLPFSIVVLNIYLQSKVHCIPYFQYSQV